MQKLTYLQYHLKNGRLIRWPEQFIPINVFIAPCSFYSMNDSDKYYYSRMVMDALQEWERAGEGRFSFNVTNNLYESNMNVEWRRVDRKSLGNCSFNYDEQSRLYSAEVSIGISDGIIHRKYMDENEVYHTILHEIGHALGLGHSPNSNDIMYTPHQYGQVSLSGRDMASVQWLYSLPYGTSVKSLNETYSLNLNNIDDIIMEIVFGSAESNFEKTLKQVKKPVRDLEDEQEKLAKIKKFQMTLQNIKLPKEITDKFKEM